MSFISIEFVILLSITFTLLHSTRNRKFHNLVILASSYFFYGWWDWRYLSMLAGLSLLNFVAALVIAKEGITQTTRKTALWFAVAGSLVTLCYFKYMNFFLQNLMLVLKPLGINSPGALQITLPLGISFLVFQALAYTVDVYRKEQPVERDVIKFLGFLSFFPQLVAGPIERAHELLSQFDKPRSLSREGIQRAVWFLAYGFFVKVALADSLAPMVDSALQKDQYSAVSVVFGSLLFGFQIYFDFFGYSLIAKGAAILLGFSLSDNFLFPYWSVSITEFWQRWHITLGSWLRDYLYIPLGGNRHGALRTYRNLIVTMVLGGLWHGASWNFVAWGLLHGVSLAVWRGCGARGYPTTRIGKIFGWFFTMIVVFIGWFLFRVTDTATFLSLVNSLTNWVWLPVHSVQAIALVSVVVTLAVLEWPQQFIDRDYFVSRIPAFLRHIIVATLVLITVIMLGQERPSFIYFQF